MRYKCSVPNYTDLLHNDILINNSRYNRAITLEPEYVCACTAEVVAQLTRPLQVLWLLR
jgi:hypothetical protein